MSMRFNPPPNWPSPPPGWTPRPGWRPDPSWGPAPPGWRLWVGDPIAYPPPSSPVVPFSAPQPRSAAGPAMVALAAGSCGLAGFVPPLWAARQRPDDAPFRRRMHATAAGLFALMLTGTVLRGAEDVGGTARALAPLGGTLLFVNLVLAVTVAVLVRNTRPDPGLPGVAEHLARRRLREQYRRLALEDPSLARSMRVGRPDLPRHLDDGGLLDLNAIPAERLGPLAGLSSAEASRVAEARQRLGRVSSVEELAVYADLSDAAVTSLRERALFI